MKMRIIVRAARDIPTFCEIKTIKIVEKNQRTAGQEWYK